MSERLLVSSSSAEESAFDTLAGLTLQFDVGVKKASRLFKTTLEKALFSSSFACAETLEKRISKLANATDSAELADRQALAALLNAVNRIEKDSFSKYGKLLALLKKIGWTGKQANGVLS
jgi:hypothetical protein